MKSVPALIALVLFGAAASAQTAPPPPSSSASQVASIGKPHECQSYYPVDALLAKQEGTAVVAFTITESGDVKDPAIQTSSGSSTLDQTSLDCVKDWHYKPAEKDGKAVSTPWRAKVVWLLNGWTPQPYPQKMGRPTSCAEESIGQAEGQTRPSLMDVSFRVDVHGRTKDIVVQDAVHNAQFDDAAVACVSKYRYTPAIIDGKPVETEWRTIINWALGGPDLDGVVGPHAAAEAHKCSFPRLVEDHTLGTAVVAFRVTVDGAVDNIKVIRSSGNRKLDYEAARCISGWKYDPATRNGTPVEFANIVGISYGILTY